MARCLSHSWRAHAGLLALFTLSLVLSGCSLQLPGSHANTPSGRYGSGEPVPGTIKEFQVDALGGINQIFFDHTGNVWFFGPSGLGWMSPSGHVTKLEMPDDGRSFTNITPGSGGNWIRHADRAGKGMGTPADGSWHLSNTPISRPWS
jgi:hypothetical protein